jgi:hypothetical protein
LRKEQCKEDAEMRRGTLFWGAILVIIGFVLLLDNLGFFGGLNVWDLLWPAFLILLGVWILFGRVLRKSTELEHAQIPLEGAQRARVRIQHGAGRLNVHSIDHPTDLAEGDFGGGLDVNTRREGDTLVVRMGVPAQWFPFFWLPGDTLDWSVGFKRDLPLALDFETGANESDIDLTELKVSELRLKSGASSTRVLLPKNAGHTRVEIEVGAASVDLRVPDGVAARLRSRGGLSSVDVDTQRFPRTGDTYQSADYDTARDKVDIDIQLGVGSATIR